MVLPARTEVDGLKESKVRDMKNQCQEDQVCMLATNQSLHDLEEAFKTTEIEWRTEEAEA